VFADAQLVDMTGTGLLDRVSLILPHAARVVLTDEGPAGDLADRPASALVTDVWSAPTAPEALVARFVRERRALRRMHALQCQLGEIHEALDVLRDRYTQARRTRDRIIASAAALQVHDAGCGGEWWEDFAQLTRLAETGCPVHPRRLDGAALADALRRSGIEAPETLGAVTVLTDPTLLGESLARVATGLRGIGVSGAQPLATARVLGGRGLVISVEVFCSEAPAPADLLDPLACLPGTRDGGTPLDLPLAEALCRAQGAGHRLGLEATMGVFHVHVELPLAPAVPSAPAAAIDPRGASAPPAPAVVREVDRTL
jgi:hypothetical protein